MPLIHLLSGDWTLQLVTWLWLGGHKYIIVVVDYITKRVEAMLTYNNDGGIIVLFIFNQTISHFGIHRDIFTNHESHFQKKMMSELALSKFGFTHENYSSHYPKENV